MAAVTVLPIGAAGSPSPDCWPSAAVRCQAPSCLASLRTTARA